MFVGVAWEKVGKKDVERVNKVAKTVDIYR